ESFLLRIAGRRGHELQGPLLHIGDAAAAAQTGLRLVDGDVGQPGRKALRLLQLIEVLVGAHVGVLQDVLRLRLVAHERPKHAEEPLVVAPHHELEKPRLARSDAPHQLGVLEGTHQVGDVLACVHGDRSSLSRSSQVTKGFAVVTLGKLRTLSSAAAPVAARVGGPSMRQIPLAIALVWAIGCTTNGTFSDPAAGGNTDQLAASARDSDHKKDNDKKDNDDRNQQVKLSEGKHIFRFDTFGDESYWGGTLRL